jgi:iron complex outermembrane receptor protein
MLSGQDDASIPYDLTAVRPERALDVEAGAEYRSPRLAVRANAYAMEFRNEIALSGELSEIGLPLRRNVARSHRRGLELEMTWQPWTPLRLTTAASLSRNRIAEWTQFYDVYDAEGSYLESVSRVHRDVSPLLTPTLVLNQGVEWTPSPALGLGIRGRYVSKAYLDNTNQDALTTPSFFSLEASASLGLSRWIEAGDPRIRVQVNNLLDNRRIWPSGYSYLSFTRDASGAETLAGIPYYYPQATRSVFVTLEIKL